MQNAKELKKRDLILNGNLLKAILVVALPILFYNLCNYLYGIFDMMIVENAGIGEAADIVVLDQIKSMISTIGSALSTGGGILIARYYGAKDILKAKKCSNTLFCLGIIITIITFIFIPFGIPFLKLLKTDQTTIDNAIGYYNIQIIILMITTMNNVFIAIEKSKGNTVRLLFLNLGVIAIKISLTCLFAYGPFENVTVSWLGFATLVAQLFMFIFGFILCILPNNVLRINVKEFNLSKNNSINILKLSLPVFLGRFLFSFGKVFINSQATVVYGKKAVGALGISNTMAGCVTTCTNSFEDAGATIVSQNYGNNNGRRIEKFYIINFIVLSIVSFFGMLISFFIRKGVAGFFAGDDIEYKEMIIKIFTWECLDLLFTGFLASAQSYLYGMGKTKITALLSMVQLFGFRIPTLLILMYGFKMNYVACGIAMFVSNASTGIIAIIISSVLVYKMRNNVKYRDLYE